MNTRVRFAPSPTGALHIGGVRTALYNYLLAKKAEGDFLLRIEDTDQTRYVEGAEGYIQEALQWCGLIPDESPVHGGEYGPYRQSDRQAIYQEYTQELIKKGQAYYAFDTAEELNAVRAQAEAAGKHSFKYARHTRLQMRNSLSLSSQEVAQLLESDTAYTVRLKVPDYETVDFEDLIRGAVSFQTAELDDKILMKSDGLPTYHLANVVDDHLMQITHVVRGEEWLSSTAHHVLLYRAFGWEESMPLFAHLPLIMKPTGKGKLSKRDGQKLGIPVFPLNWEDKANEATLLGFREAGFLPEAVINFLAMLGWNPGTEQELFSMQELIEAFTLEQVSKGGARFDYDKALWFNQQCIQVMSVEDLVQAVRPFLPEAAAKAPDEFLHTFVSLFQQRVQTLADFYKQGYYCFEPIREYHPKTVRKRWKPEKRPLFEELTQLLASSSFEALILKEVVLQFIEKNELSIGQVFSVLRLALTGEAGGPDLFPLMALIGNQEAIQRLHASWQKLDDYMTN